MAESAEDGWLYHLPAFLEQVREQGAQGIVSNFDFDVGGLLYHHRGARVPAHDATFVWRDDRFEVELDAVGPRSGWAVFDATRAWDVFLWKAAGDAPCLVWMTDGEFDAEEADQFPDKTTAVGAGRFSFGLYVQSPAAWDDLEERVAETDAPCLLNRPSGRTLLPETDLSAYEEVVPPELLDSEESAPDYLGLRDAHVAYGQGN